MGDNLRRKCLKCGRSPSVDPDIKLYRFPNPGPTNTQRCELWARFCFPEAAWSSIDFQQKLYAEHRMLCDIHFHKTAFTNFAVKKLNRHAVPDAEQDRIQPSFTTSITLPYTTDSSDSYVKLWPSDKHCCVPGCRESGGVTLHRFPNPKTSIEKFSIWVSSIGGNIAALDADVVFHNRRVCDKHFEDIHKYPKNRLSSIAVPQLHLMSDRFRKQPSNEETPPETETTDHVVEETSTLEETTIETAIEEDTSANIIIQDTVTSSVNGEDSTEEFIEDLDDDVSMSDNCDDHDDDVRPDAEHLHIEQPVPTANEKNTSYWKRQLSYILHNTQFCGICLCTKDNMNTVNDTLEIFVGGRSHSKTVLEILDVVFKEDDEILSNSQICNACTKNIIQSYMFIQRAKQTSRMLKCHLNDLYNKSCYIRNNILNDEKQPKNVLITLENYDDKHHWYNPVHIAPAKKSEVISNKEAEETEMQKPKYKCSICNLFLPSYKTWRLHEKSAHRDKKHKVDPNRLRQLRKICKLCCRVIHIGGLAEHMTKYHKHSMTRSPRNIAIVSGGDLNTHTIEKLSNKYGKCLTCLKNYKEEELEQQPCRFCCAKCAEASCLHYKYLRWYREQISKGVLRAKCLHCEYVCKSEETLLKHVNMCHLKYLSKIAIRS